MFKKLLIKNSGIKERKPQLPPFDLGSHRFDLGGGVLLADVVHLDNLPLQLAVKAKPLFLAITAGLTARPTFLELFHLFFVSVAYRLISTPVGMRFEYCAVMTHAVFQSTIRHF